MVIEEVFWCAEVFPAKVIVDEGEDRLEFFYHVWVA